MKATDMLRNQHREVEALIHRFDRNFGEPEIDPMLRELATALGAHLLAEREIFYPECAEALNDREAVRPTYRRQAELVDKLRSLETSRGDQGTLRALAHEVERAFRAHLEEEHELYPKIEPLLGDKRLEDLCGEMDARYEEAVGPDFEALFAEGVVEEADLDRYLFKRRERTMYQPMPKKEHEGAVTTGVPSAVRHTAENEPPQTLTTPGRRTKPKTGAEGTRPSHAAHATHTPPATEEMHRPGGHKR